MAVTDPKDESELIQVTLTALQTSISQLHMAERVIHEQAREIDSLRAELEAERQRFKGYFESSPDALLVTTFDGLIMEANREAAAMLGSLPADLARKQLVVYIAEDERMSFCARLKSLYAIPTRLEMKFRVQPPGGEAFPAALRVGTVYHPDKTPKALRWTVCKTGAADLKAADSLSRDLWISFSTSGI
jgi:PAS domain S-box-containing protein